MAKESKQRLVLLDAHAIIHRAYHALPKSFASDKGEPTGALYGLSTMLMRIVADLEPDLMAACYDLPEPTYRHEAYKEYKATRPKAEDGLISQLIRSRDIMKAFGIPIYEKAGFEADDILGTIAEKLKKENGIEIIIASGDMDTMQLVEGKKVRVYTLKRGIKETSLYDERAVVERFGFAPKFIPDFKGLAGDQSDNIPGVRGIGETGATKLVAAFGTIENIYKKLDKDPDALTGAGIKERVQNLLKENRDEAFFSKELAVIQRDVDIGFSLKGACWRDNTNPEKIRAIFGEFGFRSLLSRLDDFFKKNINAKDGAAKKSAGAPQQGSLNEAAGESVDEIELGKTALALWILDSNITNPSLEDILHFARTRSFSKARDIILEKVEREGLLGVYREIELPLAEVVEAMEARGVKIDTKYLDLLSKKYHREIRNCEKKIWKEAGREFNINSPKQLGEILFDHLGLKPKGHKKTSTGARSTRESELRKLEGEHPAIEHIFAYRELQKLLSTYIDNIPKMVDAKCRLHAKFLQAGTTTGRMSSQEPNLQNIPIKTERGYAIRKAFRAEEGFKLAAFDYSQIELRIAAILSGDERLIAIFKNGEDVHTAVASEVYGIEKKYVDREMRRRAKVINFGILYGMGVSALRGNLRSDRAQAQKFYNEYFTKFAGLAEYLEKSKAGAHKKGYSETLFGRRRLFPGINSELPNIRALQERQAANAPIQGTSADIIKIAMRRAYEYIQKIGAGSDIFLLLQVHDELVYEIRESVFDNTARNIKTIMENVLSAEQSRGVPIIVNAYKGENWGELQPIS